MKKAWVPGICMLLLVASCGLFSGSAVSYNDKIVNQQKKIMQATMEFSGKFETASPEELEGFRLKIVSITDTAISEVSAMKPFRGNTEMRDMALELFKFYKRTFETDYKRMMEIMGNPDMTLEDYEEYEEIVQRINDEEVILDEKFQKVQEEFAKKYNFQLKENALQKEFENM